MKTTVLYASWLNKKINNTTESYTTWLYQALLIVINIETNVVVQQKHHLKYINAKYTVHRITPHLNFHCMKKCTAFVN